MSRTKLKGRAGKADTAGEVATSAKRRWVRRGMKVVAGLLALGLVGVAGVVATVAGCMSAVPSSGSVKIQTRLERIEHVSAAGTNATGKLLIRWNAYAMPFIEAERDEDVPYAMGLVHAHLRLGQMQLLRMGAQGRLAEMAGPLATDIDHTLRAIDFAGAAATAETALRDDTRKWVERYVQGINDYQASSQTGRGELPPDSKLLAIPQEAWTVRDVLTIGRLAGTDINWGLLGAYLRNRDEPGFAKVYQRMLGWGRGATPSFGPGAGAQPIPMLGEFSKSGSNSWVVMGRMRPERDAATDDRRNAALIASDPHVGFNVPALWVVVGARSPGYEAMGFTIPGLPVVLLGTNGTIAWGGTNMVGLASAMYDVTDVPPAMMTSRTERIAVRFWADAERVIETSPVGPVMTDTPLLKPATGAAMPRAERRRKIAWSWRGQYASDEISAFLDANRARDFKAFRSAFAPYAVSGQNFLYADAQGNIGQVVALSTSPAAGRIATQSKGGPIGKVSSSGEASPPFATEAAGRGFVGPAALPFAYNPDAGYLISANNTPVNTYPPVTLTTNSNDRVDRLAQLIREDREQTVASHQKHQMDVYSIAAHRLAKAVVATAGASGREFGDSAAKRAIADLDAWDGRYAIDSRGAAVMHRVLYFLGKSTYDAMYGKKSAAYLLGSSALADFLREDLGTPENPGPAAKLLARALRDADDSLEPGQVWGDIHRLRVSHPLGLVPIVGGSWRFDEFPVAGSLTTVLKTATDAGPGVQRSRYGANARHISDLRDPDENYFVLMGGQDGWMGSVNFADQVPLWREGKLIRVPFTAKAVEADFPTVTRIR